MTVNTTNNKVEENGNGVKTNFEFNFVLNDNSDLKVYKYVIADKEAVLQVENVDYIVPVRALGSVGGSVEYTVAPTTEERSILIRELPITQETPLINNSKLPSKALEDAYDKNTMISQQLDERLNRTFKSGIGTNPGDIDFTLPTFKPKKAFIVDDTGTRVILSDDDYNDQLANVTTQADNAQQSAQNAAAEVSRAQAFANDAQTSATNAGQAETNAATSASNASTSAQNALTSENNARTEAVNAATARNEAVTAKNNAETAETGAKDAEQNVIDLLDQFPDLVPTDTGRLGVVNEAGTGYDLLPSGTAGEVLTSNGSNTKPEYKPAPATVNVVDNLTSTSAIDALSANQGRVLKGLTDVNAANITTNTNNISSNTSLINTVDGKIGAVEAKADANTGRITTAETNIFNNSQAITTNTSNITANTQAIAKIPVTNPVDTGRLAIVNATGDAFELLGTGVDGQVLTSSGPNAIPTFENVEGDTVVIDNLLSTSAFDALSANQGRILKGFTDTNASAITNNTNLINRIPPTNTQDTGKLLAVDPNGAEFDLLNTGTSGQVLTSGGINTLPTFQDPPSGVGFSVNKIEVTGDYTLTLDAFDGGFDIVLIEAFTTVEITIDTSSSKYFDLLGKNIILQNMDNRSLSIIFTPDASITGYRFGNYNVNGYTRSVITLLTVEEQNLKILYVDDQGSLQQILDNEEKLDKYVNPVAGLAGMLTAVDESGGSVSTINAQGNAGEVLTSRGAGLLPSFQPASGGGSGSYELISTTEVVAGVTNVDFILPTDDPDATFKVIIRNLTSLSSLDKLYIRLSTNNGFTFQVTNYGFTIVNAGADNDPIIKQGIAEGGLAIQCTYAGLASSGYISSEIIIINALQPKNTTIMHDTLEYRSIGDHERYLTRGEGFQINRVVHNAIRFSLITDDMESGSISLYRIKS